MQKDLQKKDIIHILKELSIDRPIFCSEADFQLELAYRIKNYLKRNDNDVTVLLEYYQQYADKSMYIDILVIIGDKWYPIELKYKTKSNTDASNYLKYDDKGIEFPLKNHVAQNINCYSYLLDVHRIEEVKNNIGIKFKRGFAIMLTNDDCYWKGPRKDSNSNKYNCHYNNFIIAEDKKIPIGKLEWDEGIGNKTKNKYPSFTIVHNHDKFWIDYSELLETNFLNKYTGKDSVCQFRYLITEIE